MNQYYEPVKDFFDRPFYLERGRYVIENRILLLRDLLGEVNHAKILDLGCGDGSLSIPFFNATNKFTLVDLSPRMIELAGESIPEYMRDRVKLINAPIDDIESLESYDIVICVGLLAHVPSIDAAINKIAQCMKPGALAVIEFTPNPNPIGKLFLPYYKLRKLLIGDEQGYSTNKIPLKQLLKMASSHSLRFTKQRRHFFPIPTLSRWPSSWVQTYVRFTLKNPIFSRIGTEHIMLFTKLK
jgi:2-polyprenyl-3-methyl-5-hydroxy-6-metoxy-1,4-benzoquinol methylase